MLNLDRNKIIAIVGAIGLLLIAVFQMGFYKKSDQSIETPAPSVISQPAPVSTNPSQLENAVVLPTQEISITFNQPLFNLPEIRWKLDPSVEMEVKISDDRKTVYFKPKEAYSVGSGYSLHIGKETKFESEQRLADDAIWHFRTIEYRGI